MFFTRIRLIMAAVFLLFAFISPILLKWSYHFVLIFLFTAVILIFSHFKHGPILSILLALKKGNISKAQQLVESIQRPQWLNKRYLSYYYFAKALLASHKQDAIEAIQFSEKAIASPYLQEHEKSMLHYNISRSYFEQKDFAASKEQLELIQLSSLKDLFLKQRVEQLKEALKNESNGQ